MANWEAGRAGSHYPGGAHLPPVSRVPTGAPGQEWTGLGQMKQKPPGIHGVAGVGKSMTNFCDFSRGFGTQPGNNRSTLFPSLRRSVATDTGQEQLKMALGNLFGQLDNC